MIIIVSIIETNHSEVEKSLHIIRLWVYHLNNRFIRTLILPTNDKEILKDFAVKEYNWKIIIIFYTFKFFV